MFPPADPTLVAAVLSVHRLIVSRCVSLCLSALLFVRWNQERVSIASLVLGVCGCLGMRAPAPAASTTGPTAAYEVRMMPKTLLANVL